MLTWAGTHSKIILNPFTLSLLYNILMSCTRSCLAELLIVIACRELRLSEKMTIVLIGGLVDRIICRAYLIAKCSEVKTDTLVSSRVLQIVGSLPK